jgi:hypothetical protein
MSLLVVALIAALVFLLIFGLATVGTVWFWLGVGAVVVALVLALTGDRRLG